MVPAYRSGMPITCFEAFADRLDLPRRMRQAELQAVDAALCRASSTTSGGRIPTTRSSWHDFWNPTPRVAASLLRSWRRRRRPISQLRWSRHGTTLVLGLKAGRAGCRTAYSTSALVRSRSVPMIVRSELEYQPSRQTRR